MITSNLHAYNLGMIATPADLENFLHGVIDGRREEEDGWVSILGRLSELAEAEAFNLRKYGKGTVEERERADAWDLLSTQLNEDCHVPGDPAREDDDEITNDSSTRRENT